MGVEDAGLAGRDQPFGHGVALGIEVLDHVVVGDGCYRALGEDGLSGRKLHVLDDRADLVRPLPPLLHRPLDAANVERLVIKNGELSIAVEVGSLRR